MGKALKYKRVIIFGGSVTQINPEVCNEICDTDFIICADAGYKFAFANNLKPNLILGDFDSAPYPTDADCEIIKLPTHKSQTDLQFAVEWAIKAGYEDFILSGVTGGRLDHTLATLSTLNYLSDKAKNFFVWDLNNKIYIIKDFAEIKKPDYDCYFSVFSLTESSGGVFIKGAEYPLENTTLVNSFPLGVSNEFKDSTVEIGLKFGKLIVMIVKKD